MDQRTRAISVITLVIVVVVVIAVARMHTPKPAENPGSSANTTESGQNLPQTYSNPSEGFSLRLPVGYKVDESYKYQQLGPGKDISGVKFMIPESLATGTNLSPDSYLSVEEIPQMQTCSAMLFLNAGKVMMVTEGGTIYSVASSTGAGAGNRYEEIVYALSGTNPCIAVRYFIHYSAFENYPPGSTVKQFDNHALFKQFDAIRQTLMVVPQAKG